MQFSGQDHAVLKVLIADDQALVRAGFKVLIDTDDGLEVVGEAANGREATELVKRHQPDVVLMDIRMPEMDGIEATKAIVGDPECDSTKVLVLTTFDLDEYVFSALRAGASGFLLKDTDPADLLRAIRIVADGESLLAPRITSRLIAQFTAQPEATVEADTAGAEPSNHEGLELLTEREREVMVLVARGLSNGEIAEELIVSHATAKTHVSRILMKLNARDRAQLVVIAYESGLIRPGVV